MSYKDEIKRMLTTIANKNEHEESLENITKVIETIYTKALLESKKTGQSVESITYEILEGVEEGLDAIHKIKIEQVLQNASDIITDVIHKCAQENISHKHQNLQIAAKKLEETIEAEKSHLLESMEAFKAYANDHTHIHFEKNLHQLEEKLKHFLNTVTDKIDTSKK